MSMAKAFWNDQPSIADMSWPIFGIWGLWNILLTAMVVFLFWLYVQGILTKHEVHLEASVTLPISRSIYHDLG